MLPNIVEPFYFYFQDSLRVQKSIIYLKYTVTFDNLMHSCINLF